MDRYKVYLNNKTVIGDVYPWNLDAPEEHLSQAMVRDGFVDFGDVKGEYSTLQWAAWAPQRLALRQQIQQVREADLQTAARKRAFPATSLLTEGDKKSFFARLASDEPLDDLAKSDIPRINSSSKVAVRNTLDTLFRSNVSIMRATWFIKISFLSEYEASPAKATVAWTRCLTEDLLPTLLGTASARVHATTIPTNGGSRKRSRGVSMGENEQEPDEEVRKWHYVQRLLHWHFGLALVSRVKVLDWVLWSLAESHKQQRTSTTIGQRCLLLWMCSTYLAFFCRTREHAHELFTLCLTQLPAQDAVASIRDSGQSNIERLVWSILRFVSATVPCTASWVQSHLAPRASLREEPHACLLGLPVLLSSVVAVLDQLHAIPEPRAGVELVRTLLHYISPFTPDYPATHAFHFAAPTAPDHAATASINVDVLFAALTWAVTDRRSLLPYARTVLPHALSSLAEHVGPLLQPHLMLFLEAFTPKSARETQRVCELFGRFIALGLFSYNQYLRNLLTSGALPRQPDTTLQRRHRLYAANFPLEHANKVQWYQRSVALFGMSDQEELRMYQLTRRDVLAHFVRCSGGHLLKREGAWAKIQRAGRWTTRTKAKYADLYACSQKVGGGGLVALRSMLRRLPYALAVRVLSLLVTEIEVIIVASAGGCKGRERSTKSVPLDVVSPLVCDAVDLLQSLEYYAGITTIIGSLARQTAGAGAASRLLVGLLRRYHLLLHCGGWLDEILVAVRRPEDLLEWPTLPEPLRERLQSLNKQQNKGVSRVSGTKGSETIWQGHDPIPFPGQLRQILSAPGPFVAAELCRSIVRLVSPGAVMTCVRTVYLELMVQATRLAAHPALAKGEAAGNAATERMQCLCALQVQLSDILGKQLPGTHAVFSEALEQVLCCLATYGSCSRALLEVCGDGVIVNIPDIVLEGTEHNGDKARETGELVLGEVECLAQFVAMLARAEFISLGMLCTRPCGDLLTHHDERVQLCSVKFLGMFLRELFDGGSDLRHLHLEQLAPLFSDADALLPIVRTLQHMALPTSATKTSCKLAALLSLGRLCAHRPFRECTLGRGAWLLPHLEVLKSREAALKLWQKLLRPHLAYLEPTPTAPSRPISSRPMSMFKLLDPSLEPSSPVIIPLLSAAHALCDLDTWNLPLRWVELHMALEGDWPPRLDPASPALPRNSPGSSGSDSAGASPLPVDAVPARFTARGLAQGLLASVWCTPEHANCVISPDVALHAISHLGASVAHSLLQQAGEVLMGDGCARLLRHMRKAESGMGVDSESRSSTVASPAAGVDPEDLASRWPEEACTYTARFHGASVTADDTDDLYAYDEQPVVLAHLLGAAFYQISDSPRLGLVRLWLGQLEELEEGLGHMKQAAALDDCCRLVQHSVLLRLRCLNPLLEVAGQRRSKGWALVAPDEARRLMLLLVRFATLPTVRRKVPVAQSISQGDGSCVGVVAYNSGWTPPAVLASGDHGGRAEGPTLVLGDALAYILWLLQTLGEALGREVPQQGSTKTKEARSASFPGLAVEVAQLCDARQVPAHERRRLAQVLIGPASEVTAALLGTDDGDSWTALEGVSSTPLAQSFVAQSKAIYDW